AVIRADRFVPLAMEVAEVARLPVTAGLGQRPYDFVAHRAFVKARAPLLRNRFHRLRHTGETHDLAHFGDAATGHERLARRFIAAEDLRGATGELHLTAGNGITVARIVDG